MIKYGIWEDKYKEWAWPDLVSSMPKPKPKTALCKDKEGKFETDDINLAFRYQEYIIGYYKRKKWNTGLKLSVKEKQE